MAHNVETMAWTNSRPWHGLGYEVEDNLSAEEMLVAAGLDWRVEKVPLYADYNGQKVFSHDFGLVRDRDNKYLATIGKDWEPVQNSEAFAFFNKFVENGDMKMETAGSLQGGNYVWGLAKIKKSFELFGGDVINPYLLFTNPHKYGLPVDIRFTAIRVECNNTLTMALGKKANFFKASHRMVFDPEMAKEALGIASKKMDDYIEQVQVLGENQYTKETVDNYFSEVFPVQVVKGKDESKKEKSKNHKEALIALENQPGLEYAPGSWWQAYNAVTYITDHLMARTQEARVTNIWYGQTKELKIKAFEKARDYAFKA